jgi:hypothetical protein
VDCKRELFQVVLALHSCGCLPDLLNGRQKQPDEDSNDRNDDQQFNERERPTSWVMREHGWHLQKMKPEMERSQGEELNSSSQNGREQGQKCPEETKTEEGKASFPPREENHVGAK